MPNQYENETQEVFDLKRKLDQVVGELEMYKCYKTAYEARIARLKEAQRRAHLPFRGIIE